MKLVCLLPLLAAVMIVLGATAACAPQEIDRITVAYLVEWPTPNHVPRLEQTYDNELGVEVEWRAFENGNAMNEAMAAGDVQIAYAQGFVPWVVAVSNGRPFHLVGVAVSYAEADNCIVHQDTGITQSNARELEGKQVATAIGNVTHYKLLRTLDHLGVDVGKVNIVPMNGGAAVDALARGEVAMACAFGGPLQRMWEFGSELMTAAEQEAIGIRVFDVVVAPTEFASEHPGLLRKFMEVTEQANAAYRADPSRYEAGIARGAGLDLDATRSLLAVFSFPSAAEQKSGAWMGGGIEQIAGEVARFFVEQGQLDRKLDDYGFAINSNFLP